MHVKVANRSRSFQGTAVIENGLRDCHKLTVSFFRAWFRRIPPKTIEYTKFKNSNEASYLYNLDQELIKGTTYKDSNDQYDVITAILAKFLDSQATVKRKKRRNN